MRKLLLGIACLLISSLGGAGRAAAQSPQFVPAYPLYCQGPLTTSAPSGRETTTSFTWAATGAGASSPQAGQCSWADRAARGPEILSGGNIICDWSSAMKTVAAGKFVEIGVARDPLANNCMHLARYIGIVSPPFSAVPAIDPFVRQSIATLTPAQITSLQHGIAVMMSRPASDPTSYAFQANIHGTYSDAVTPQEMLSWNNCEHGSYYFLSWHRMYLYFFDRILRAASGDPSLVLPYWDWSDSAQRTLPLAFRQPANASNPLYIAPPGRPAALDAGTAVLGAGTVDYSAAFADTAIDSSAGSGASFGGQIVPPMQFNEPHGDFESQPHDVVHVALGGLMSDPDTAAQDPIFWLHHANIDRMWNSWLAQGGGRTDPADAAWQNTQFTFYDEAGHAVYLTGSEIVDTVRQLNYRYDDEPVTQEHKRILLATSPQAPKPVSSGREQVLMGTTQNASRMALGGSTLRVQLPLTASVFQRMHLLVGGHATARVFLRLDDIQYEKSSGVYYEVYVNPPVDTKLDIHTPGYIGNLALFGLKPHAMMGHQPLISDIYVQFDISKLLSKELVASPKAITVLLVPRGLFDKAGTPLPVPEGVQGTVGKIRIIGG